MDKVELGMIQKLKIVKKVDFGLYLDGFDYGEILLPLKDVPASCEVDEELEVFIYLDSEDRIIATTRTPFVTIGEAVMLKAVDITTIGAFFDWGLQKDLLVPYKEQNIPARNGMSYPVTVYVDNSNRLTGSMRIDKYLKPNQEGLNENDQCDVLIYGKTDLGFKAVINKTTVGLFYNSELFKPLKIGQKTKAYISKIREDGKIDLRIDPPGIKKSEMLSDKILKAINDENGTIKLNDKSSPEDIKNRFQVSKRNFKDAIGILYKQKKIIITKAGIRLPDKNKSEES